MKIYLEKLTNDLFMTGNLMLLNLCYSYIGKYCIFGQKSFTGLSNVIKLQMVKKYLFLTLHGWTEVYLTGATIYNV